ncbi:hypothetical protein HRR81_000345 [Exophiala dermatitidis]|nr:hypothetical protein HRR77_000650 [Exophiala dermatitidis]KAJ4584539.1 hypothetical protein HRR81_000345 [Exophiala dermatitidis]KAJ4590376.1 hypothetical protein HRR82_000735 [Exophiala dermatitidis]KAJ4621452.1 hypothetical protein HRR85_001646 [Exophiala dermatitidis]KAJ4636167.1 hypothetical protein HRR86_000601 [Exophiala dermatitidis]
MPSMATYNPSRASRAVLFMQYCRGGMHTSRRIRHTPMPLHSIRYSSSDSASAASPYSPANFTQPVAKPSYSASSSSAPPASSSTSLEGNNNTLPASRPRYAYPEAQRSPITEIPGTRLTPWTWVKWMFGWRPTPTFKPAPIHVNNNPYRARKQWPPDFRTLDPKHQFHLEKTYRRRAALKWARPTWNKSIKILQQTLITLTLIYFIFICEPSDGMGTPFDGVSSGSKIYGSSSLRMINVAWAD